MYRIFHIVSFDKQLQKLSPEEQLRIIKIENHIRENPFSGKPLGYQFFREKKFGTKRIVYLVYQDYLIVLLICVSDKKSQQADIDIIKQALNDYHSIAEGLHFSYSSH